MEVDGGWSDLRDGKEVGVLDGRNFLSQTVKWMGSFIKKGYRKEEEEKEWVALGVWWLGDDRETQNRGVHSRHSRIWGLVSGKKSGLERSHHHTGSNWRLQEQMSSPKEGKEKHQKKERIWENGRGHQVTIVQGYSRPLSSDKVRTISHRKEKSAEGWVDWQTRANHWGKMRN